MMELQDKVIDIEKKLQYYKEYNEILEGEIAAIDVLIKRDELQRKGAALTSLDYWRLREESLNKELMIETHNNWIIHGTRDLAQTQGQIDAEMAMVNDDFDNVQKRIEDFFNKPKNAFNKKLTKPKALFFGIQKAIKDGEVKSDVQKVQVYRQFRAIEQGIK